MRGDSVEVDTGEGRVVVQVSGDGSPIVLLHGVGHDHHDFDAVLPALASRHRCFAIDWPGRGESEMFAQPSAASVGAMGRALDDVVEALGIEDAILIGNSVGGAASVHLAARRPERVRGLVLVDPGGFTRHSLVTRAFCWFQGHAFVRRLIQLPFARAYLRRRNEATRAILVRMKAARARPGVFEMEAAMWRSFATAENDLTDAARSVTAPTLVVWGAHDPVLPSATDGARVRELFPDARFASLDTGHVPFAEDPEAFLRVVEPFISSFLATATEIAC
jgi:pimeloyl-ACP methyl ester carboxylesterase